MIKKLARTIKDILRLEWDTRNKKFLKYYNDETNNDRWVVDILKGKKNGFFIEAGAADGKKNSCTYTLERYFGWKGILVEPGYGFKRLKKNRPKSIIINKILSSKKSEQDFILLPKSPLSSCTKKSFDNHRNKIVHAHKGNRKFPAIKVKKDTINFKQLLKTHNCPNEIDYLALDIEGSEYDVMKEFPFDKYKIKCISVEGKECSFLLKSKGYKQVRNKYNKKAPWENYFILK